MGIGGDLTSVFIKRSDGKTRRFTVATGGDNPRINGGKYTETVESNGDGSVRPILRTRAGEREVTMNANDLQGDHEWLLAASRAAGESVVQYTHISGFVTSHQARPTGDMAKNDGNSTITVTFMGTEIKAE